MTLHGVFGGFARETVTDAGLSTKRCELSHTVAALAGRLLLHLLGLLLELHDLLFQFDYAGPFLLEEVPFDRRNGSLWW